MGALLAQQLVGAGEHVVDVPPKLSARVRLMDTGRIDKSDPNDARSAAVVALRNATLNTVGAESEHRVILRLLADRYHQLTAQRTRTVCRLHAVLCVLIEGGTGRSLTAMRATKLLAGVAIGDPITVERVATCHQFVDRDRLARPGPGRHPRPDRHRGHGVQDLGHRRVRHRPDRGRDHRRAQRRHPPVPDRRALRPPQRHRPDRSVLGTRSPGTGSTPAGTASSTTRSTPRRSPRSPTTPPAASTTSASWPRARRKKEAMRALKRRISDAVYRQLLADTRH